MSQLLLWASEQGVSDIMLAPNDPVWMRQHGRWHPVSDRDCASSEISYILDRISRQPNASAMAISGQDVDFGFEVPVGRGKRLRFRCNATGCRDRWASGVTMVMRTIPEHPPELAYHNMPDAMLAAFQPDYGLVLVTGPVGSGKTTLLFSVLRHIAQTESRHIITYESPIEYDLTSLPNRRGPVAQTEIPRHLASFEAAPRNSLRRAGDIVLFGESRDRETLKNMTIEAETGVAVYSTVHTNSVAETISRMVREFPHGEREGMAATLIAALRLIVHQRLVRTVDGDGRVPIREYLVVDDEVKDRLIHCSVGDMIPAVQAVMHARGSTLSSEAQAAFEAGRISERDYLMMKKTSGPNPLQGAL